GVAGARIASQPGIALLHREGAEAAQLDPVAAGERRRNLVEDGGNDAFDVALVKVRIELPDLENQLGFGHGAHPPLALARSRLPIPLSPPATRSRPQIAKAALDRQV